MESFEERIRFEDAQLAHYPRLAEEAARTLLTNRALATALIQLHTNHTRYVELCDFLDRKVVAMVEDAARFEWKQPTEDDSEDELPSWAGQPALCAGHTQKGKPCTRPGSLAHEGQPFCTRHYPYPESYRARREQEERAWSEHEKWRREALGRYRALEQTVLGLSRMNSELSGALRALGIPQPDARSQNVPLADRIVYVDGLAFEFTSSPSGNHHNIRRPAGSDFGIIRRVPDRGWAAYVFDPNTPGLHTSLGGFLASTEEAAIRYAYVIHAFYRIRRRRELDWYGEAVGTLSTIAGMLTTPQPLVLLCGIAAPGSGWRVFRFLRREWQCVYSGDFESEARWNFDTGEEDRSSARLLIDPAHQIVDSYADSRSLW